MRLVNLSPRLLIEIELHQYAAAALRCGEINKSAVEPVCCLPINNDLINRLGTKTGYLEICGGADLGTNACGASSGGGGSSVPENEAYGKPAAPPKKTAAQKATAVAECERVFTVARFELAFTAGVLAGSCASGNSNTLGYSIDQLRAFLSQTANSQARTCAQDVIAQYNTQANIIDSRRQVCVTAANKD